MVPTQQADHMLSMLDMRGYMQLEYKLPIHMSELLDHSH
jgi:hypothetical protein